MKHSEACEQLIRSFEGEEAEAYPDPASHGDPWTIGVGHTGPEVHKGLVWAKDQIAAALAKDLERFDAGVTSLIDGALTTQSMFDAMVSLAFNIGLSRFGTSTLVAMHRIGDYDGAQAEFQKWNKAGGVVLPGLTARRKAEAVLYGKMT